MSLPENTTYGIGPSIPKFTGSIGKISKIVPPSTQPKTIPSLEITQEMRDKASSLDYDTLFGAGNNFSIPDFNTPLEQVDEVMKPEMANLNVYDPIQKKKVPIDVDTFNNLDIKIDPITKTRYYEDKRDTSKIITEARENDALMRYNERKGLSSLDTQIDHIIPLWLGGEDAESNKQRLTIPEHDQKTLVDGIMQELIYSKTITPAQARAIYGKWKTLDTTGLTSNPYNGQIILTPTQAQRYGATSEADSNAKSKFVKEIYDAWQVEKTPEIEFSWDRFKRRGLSDLIEKTFGEEKAGKPTVADDFLKSFAGGVSNQWINTVNDEDDRGTLSTIAQITGGATGTIANLFIESAMLAAAGAAVGSIAPGVGTLLGGLTGGVAGLGKGVYKLAKGAKTAKTILNAADTAKDVIDIGKATTKGLTTLSDLLKYASGTKKIQLPGELLAGEKTVEVAKASLDLSKAQNTSKLFNDVLKNGAGLQYKPNIGQQLMANVPLFLSQGLTSGTFWEGDTTTKFKTALVSAANGLTAGAFDPIATPLLKGIGINYLGDAATNFAIGLFDSNGDVKSAAQNALVGTAFQLVTHGNAKLSGRMNEITNYAKNLENTLADKVLGESGIKLNLTESDLKPTNRKVLEQKLTDAYSLATQRAIKAQNEGEAPSDIQLQLTKVAAALQTKYKQSLTGKELEDFNIENAKSIGKILQDDFQNNNKPIVFKSPGNADLENWVNANWHELLPSSYKYANDATMSNTMRNSNDSLAATLRAMGIIKEGGKVGTITGQGLDDVRFSTGFNPFKKTFDYINSIPKDQLNKTLGDKIILMIDDSPATQSAIKAQNEKLVKTNIALAKDIDNINKTLGVKKAKEDPFDKTKDPTVVKLEELGKQKQDELDANNEKLKSNREKAVIMYIPVFDGTINGRMQMTPKLLPLGYLPTNPNLRSKTGLDFNTQQQMQASPIKDALTNENVYDSIRKTGGNFMMADLIGKPEKTPEGLLYATFAVPKDYDKRHSIYNTNYENKLRQIQLEGISDGGIRDLVDTVEALGVKSNTGQLDIALTNFQKIFESDIPLREKKAKLKELSTIFDDSKFTTQFIRRVDELTMQDLIKTLDDKISRTTSFDPNDTRYISDALLLRELNNIFTSPALYDKRTGSLNKAGKSILRIPLIARSSKKNIDLSKLRKKIETASPANIAKYQDVKKKAIENNRQSSIVEGKDVSNMPKNDMVQANKMQKIAIMVQDGKINSEKVAESKTISDAEIDLMKVSTDPVLQKTGSEAESIRKDLKENDIYTTPTTSNLSKMIAEIVANRNAVKRAPITKEEIVSKVGQKGSEFGISGAPKTKIKEDVIEQPKVIDDTTHKTTYNIPTTRESTSYIRGLDEAINKSESGDKQALLDELTVDGVQKLAKNAIKDDNITDSEEFANSIISKLGTITEGLTPRKIESFKKEFQKIFQKALSGKEQSVLGVKGYEPISGKKGFRPILEEILTGKSKPSSFLEDFIDSNPKYKDQGVKIVTLDKVDKKIQDAVLKADNLEDLVDVYTDASMKAGYIPLGTSKDLNQTVFVKAPKEWDGKKMDLNNFNQVNKFLEDYLNDMGFGGIKNEELRKRINLLYTQDPKGNKNDKIKVITLDNNMFKDDANLDGALYMDSHDIKSIANPLGLKGSHGLKPVIADNGLLVKGQISPLDYNFVDKLDNKYQGRLNRLIKDARKNGYKIILSVDDNIKRGLDKFTDSDGIKTLDLSGDKVRYKLKKDDMDGNIGDKAFGTSILNKFNSDDQAIINDITKLYSKNLDGFFTLLDDIFKNPDQAWKKLEESAYKNKINTDKLYGFFAEIQKSGGDITTLSRRFGDVITSILGDISKNPVKQSSYSPLVPDTGVFKFKDGTSRPLERGEVAISQKLADKLGVVDGDKLGTIRYPLTTKRAIMDSTVKIVDDAFGRHMGKNVAANTKDVFEIYEGDFDGDHLTLFNYKDNKELGNVFKYISELKEASPISKISLPEEDKAAKSPVTLENIKKGIVTSTAGKQAIGQISNRIGVANTLYSNKTPIYVEGKKYIPKYNTDIDDKWRYVLQSAVDAGKYSTYYKMENFEKDPIAIMYGINDADIYKKFKQSPEYAKATRGTLDKGKIKESNVVNIASLSKNKFSSFQDLENYFNQSKITKGEAGVKHPGQILNEYIQSRMPKFSKLLTKDLKKEVIDSSKEIFKPRLKEVSSMTDYSTKQSRDVVKYIENIILKYNKQIDTASDYNKKKSLRKSRDIELRKTFDLYNKLNNKEKTFISLSALNNPRMNKDLWSVAPSKSQFTEFIWEFVLPKHREEYFKKANEVLASKNKKETL